MSDIKDPISEVELSSFLKDCPSLCKFTKASSQLLAGDGSGRSFYRVECEGIPIKSAVLLHTPSGIGPKLSGDTTYTQEQAFVELCKFFPQKGIPTPAFYGYEPLKSWVLMEDVGSVALFHFLSQPSNYANEALVDRITDLFSGDPVVSLFQQAIELITKLQQIPRDESIVGFRRFLSFENYRAEISEFSEFYATPLGLQKAAALELDKVYDAICETIMSFPKALSLFDYNAHNLFVSSEGRLRVLDFQDACLVTPARDLVSLINDRGMDELLGKQRHSELLLKAFNLLKSNADFNFIYNMTLLHWDLRVAGRFVKLNQKFQTDKYQQWIPSTLRRLGRTLQRTENNVHGLSTLLEIAYKLSPEVKDGFLDPWSLPT